jgi:CRISPR-associated endonuclease/helicase Cas3
MCSEPLAHVSEDGRVHKLSDHLWATAELSGRFASVFGSGEWGRLAGLWHDLGKFSPDFQRKLRAAGGGEAHIEARGRVDHSTAGALHAVRRFNTAGRILAYTAAGHHAGLPDWEADKTGRSALSQRLQHEDLLAAALDGGIPAEILDLPFPAERPLGRDPAFWVRMLFSCVVDADFLDTEGFFDPVRSAARGRYPPLSDLVAPFNAYMSAKQSAAGDTPVNRARSGVLARCIQEAGKPPGIFSLTVPTGGGKTLSSLAFALNHALAHGQRRIIYVIPYTSIIEQSADQFRRIFGDVVVEHHSNLEGSESKEETAQSRLACENWDAPLIVTTNVQFFESLFASRTSRCRKLHNIAGSVVVLDEAQLLPPEFLRPVLKALDELRRS